MFAGLSIGYSGERQVVGGGLYRDEEGGYRGGQESALEQYEANKVEAEKGEG